MKAIWIQRVFLCCCLSTLAAVAHAQGRPPGGAGPGGPPRGPGGMAGPGGPGGMGAPAGLPPNGPGGNPAGGPAPARSPSTSDNSRSSTHGTLQFGPVGRWWDDRQVVQAIGLRKEQQKKMDTIFNANKSAIVDSYKTLLTEQAKLDAVTKQPQVDQSLAFAQIDAVNQARASLQKANTQMLLQIRQQMDSEQIVKLQTLK